MTNYYSLTNVKNFVKLTIASSFTSADNQLYILMSDVARLQNAGILPPGLNPYANFQITVPNSSFNLVMYNSTDYGDAADDPNAEIINVQAIFNNILTVARAQEGTTAANSLQNKTYKLILTITQDLLNFIESTNTTGITEVLNVYTGNQLTTTVNGVSSTPITVVPTKATSSTLGTVKIGSNISISSDGTINIPTLATVATTGAYSDLSGAPTPYTLPIASASTLGGIKVGTGLSIDAGTGILSLSSSPILDISLNVSESVSVNQPVYIGTYNSTPVVYDNKLLTGGGYSASNVAPQTVTNSFTVGSGSNRLLVVQISVAFASGSGSPGISTVTYNGVAMTSTGTGGIYYLANPASGSNTLSFLITNTSGTSNGNYNVSAYSFSGAQWDNVSSSPITPSTNYAYVLGFAVGQGSASTITTFTNQYATFTTTNYSQTYSSAVGFIKQNTAISTTFTGTNFGTYVSIKPATITTATGVSLASSSRTDLSAPTIGFSTTSQSLIGSPTTVQSSGFLTGFTGLTLGSVYYLNDTYGTIGTSAGTVSKKVGIAISSTELLIQLS